MLSQTSVVKKLTGSDSHHQNNSIQIRDDNLNLRRSASLKTKP